MSNKDKALRAAKDLMSQADFAAARRFAMKAQKRDASLENDVSRMIMVCDVHCAALEKSGDETDWYKILQVDQNADDDAIKKQYKKLSLLIHPDKNRFPGAESAFKSIEEARRILLNKDERRLHDMKREPVSRRPAPAPSFKPQQAPTKEGFRAKSSGTSETIVVSSDSECEEVSYCSESSRDSDNNSLQTDDEMERDSDYSPDISAEAVEDSDYSPDISAEAVDTRTMTSRSRKRCKKKNMSSRSRKRYKKTIEHPEQYLDNPNNICFATSLKLRKYELVVGAQIVKDYCLKFGDNFQYIDRHGELAAKVVIWGGQVRVKKWNKICERNKLRENDSILCEVLRNNNDKVVYAIKIHIIRDGVALT